MSIDVEIKQSLFGRKTMPLEVILGEHLHYGSFVNDHLLPGQMGEGEFIAYDPRQIGRGFSVIWTPREKRKITLRLLHPSTEQELREFFSAVERMTTHWEGKLTVDGTRLRPEDFLQSLPGMLEFNEKLIRDLSQQVLSGEHDSWTLFSALWPLTLGPEEAAVFVQDPSAYGRWLHERQSVEAIYASPRFYATEQGIQGEFTLPSQGCVILPDQPTVPFGIVDTATGKALECDTWQVRFEAKENTAPISYQDFLSMLPPEKKVRYDGDHFLIRSEDIE